MVTRFFAALFCLSLVAASPGCESLDELRARLISEAKSNVCACFESRHVAVDCSRIGGVTIDLGGFPRECGAAEFEFRSGGQPTVRHYPGCYNSDTNSIRVATMSGPIGAGTWRDSASVRMDLQHEIIHAMLATNKLPQVANNSALMLDCQSFEVEK